MKTTIITLATIAIILTSYAIIQPVIIVDLGHNIVLTIGNVQVQDNTEIITDMDIVNNGGEY